MRGNFDRCLTLLWARIGDAALKKPNKRGACRLGISRKTLASWRGATQAKVDLNALGKGDAAAILHVWFWRAVHGDELPLGIDHAVFARAIRDGAKDAKIAMQFAIGVHPTGDLIGRDLRKIENADHAALLRKFEAPGQVLTEALSMAACEPD